MDFWETNERTWWATVDAPKQATPPEPEPTSMNDTTGLCAFCGFVSDDVLLGVCAECAPED